MAVSRVSKKGLTTIPAEVRRKLGIRDGDLIIWRIDEEEGKAVIKVLKDPIKYLDGKYEDLKLTYEMVEEPADRLILCELNAPD